MVTNSQTQSQMQWTRSETLALASQRCTLCFGMGLRTAKSRDLPCNCVFRAIFRACYSKFRKIANEDAAVRSTGHSDRRLLSFDTAHNRTRAQQLGHFGYRHAEYCVDFLLIARRALEGKAHLERVFKYHYLLGADFRLCNRRLNRPLADRNIFHDFYVVEQLVGRALRETTPYALFPLYEYFGQPAPSSLTLRPNHRAAA